ncbi:hypothetical protein OFC47_26255, partial [Escherichia coli]|nr:hypothetical protein [Escherichia coli]
SFIQMPYFSDFNLGESSNKEDLIIFKIYPSLSQPSSNSLSINSNAIITDTDTNNTSSKSEDNDEP